MEIAAKYKATITLEFHIPVFLADKTSITHKTPRQYLEEIIAKMQYRDEYFNVQPTIRRLTKIVDISKRGLTNDY